MNVKNIFKAALPYLIAIGIFVAISFVYFSPVMNGKVLHQMDNTHAKGMAKELMDYEEETGKHALWTNSMFGGMPAYQIKPAPSRNIYNYLNSILRLGLPYHTVAILFINLLGFYVLLRVLKVNNWLSIVGAIAYGFASYNFIIIGAGHITKAYAIGLMPAVIGGVLLTYRKRYWLGGLLTAIALGVQIASNHVQITYYLMLIIIIIGIVQFIYSILQKEIKQFFVASAVLVVAAMLAVLPNITTLWTTYEYARETIRGKSELVNEDEERQSGGLDKDYALDWSYGIAESWTLLIPNAQGGASGALGQNPDAMEEVDRMYAEMVGGQNQYWGAMPFTSGPVYVGAIICFLFILGFFVIDEKIKWWILAATILSLFLAWGKNFGFFTDFFFYNVPFYNKFRTVSMALVIAGVTIPLMAILTLREIIKNPQKIKENRIYIYLAFGLTGGVALIFYLMPSVFFDFITAREFSAFDAQKAQEPAYAAQIDTFMANLEAARISVFQADAIRSVLFILGGAGVLLLYSYEKFSKYVLIGTIGVLVLADLWFVDKRYLNNDDFVAQRRLKGQEFPLTTADNIILKDVDPNFRVLNITRNPFTEVNTSYYHKSIGGYHGAKLRRYQELIERHLGANIQKVQSSIRQLIGQNPNIRHFQLQGAIDDVLAKQHILNMLNTKHVIYHQDSMPIINMHSLGNAWFVNEHITVENANEEMEALGSVNPKKTAVIDKRFQSVIDQLPEDDFFSLDTGQIELVDYKPDELTYRTRNKNKQLAVFSEIYYDKGWKATIDDKPAEYIRVNYILRGMLIPEGTHTVEFKFEPQSYYTGQNIAFASSVLVGLLFILFLVRGIKKGELTIPKSENETPKTKTKEKTGTKKTQPKKSTQTKKNAPKHKRKR